MSNSTIERQVMAGVAVVYAARRLTSAVALKVYALALSVVGVVAFVSLPHVAANFFAIERGGLSSITVYLVTAVLDTDHVVQAALLVGAAVCFSLVVDAVRSLPFSSHHRSVAA